MKFIKGAVFLASAVLVIFILYRVQLLGGFRLLAGDRFDAAIVVSILEHWFNVLKGQSYWSQINYFYPYEKTLGHTDGYFIFGIIYSLFRFLDFDPFLSYEFVNMSVRVMGFVAFYVMGRKVFGLPFWWSLLGAVVFVLSNNISSHSQRMQLGSVYFIPVFTLLLWQIYTGIYTDNRKKIVLYGLLAGVFYGAWTITCFYISWFVLFFLIFFTVSAVVVSKKEARSLFFSRIAAHRYAVASVVFVALLSQLPLLSVYLPKSKEVGMRSIESVLSNTVPIEGIMQVGADNWMFGQIYNKFIHFLSPAYAPSGEYYNTGFAPVLFILFLIGSYSILRKRTQTQNYYLLASLSVSALLTWLMILNIGGHSAWKVVYHLIPGAKALNVVAIYQMVLTVPVIVIAMIYLSKISIGANKNLVFIVAALLCLEEINTGYIRLDRSTELARIAVKESPPPECSVFYVSASPDQATASDMADWVNNYYAHNVTAMLIAERTGLPTVNGVASFTPPDWNFGFPNNEDYDQRVLEYARRHQIEGLCKLNLTTLKWEKAVSVLP